jgi:hypothetical protein
MHCHCFNKVYKNPLYQRQIMPQGFFSTPSMTHGLLALFSSHFLLSSHRSKHSRCQYNLFQRHGVLEGCWHQHSLAL